jgi:phospholipase C
MLELTTGRSSGISRRDFLALSAGVGAISLAGCGSQSSSSVPRHSLPKPGDAPFDTVVVLMMENRSFDHFLGWLPGTNGRQAGLSYEDSNGVSHRTGPLAPDFQGCKYTDPGHTWEEVEKQYDGGRCDGFLKTAPLGDLYPIGYYVEKDLPILSVIAKNYTTFDRYFCSMMGATWQNRLYQLSGTTQVPMDQAFPRTNAERPCVIETTIFDRLREAGLSAGYYTQGEPMTGLFKSKKYDNITYPVTKFYEDAAAGRLPNVAFVEPNYTDAAEDDGTSNDYHHVGSVLQGEAFVASVHNALAASRQWKKLVFVLNFDEAGGFFDHVPPPTCRDDTPPRLNQPDRAGRRPDLKRLGFRVPAIAMGPFAPRRIEKAGPYEHCSILKMITWRWELPPLTLRDRTAKNFANALDFTAQREAATLPAFKAPPPLTAPACQPPVQNGASVQAAR